jgi:NitT/TauT family transport system permease protein
VNWLGLIALAAVLLLWEASARLNPLLSQYFPSVGAIGESLFDSIIKRALASHLLATLSRFLIAYILAAAIAVTLGVGLGYFRGAYNLAEILIEFLRPMPSVAMIPIAILILGIGSPMIIAVTVYATVWPILINTIDGVRSVESTLIETGRTFGLGGWRILRTIVLPAALPHIVTGLRISVAIALILVTTGEMVVGGSGLGFFILDEERSLRSSNMYAGIALVGIVGYGLNRLFLFFESRVMAWHSGMTARRSL